MESGLSFKAADVILKQEYNLTLSLVRSQYHRNNPSDKPPIFIPIEERIRIVRKATCCPGGSITLLICPMCYTPHDKHYVFCRKCHRRLIKRCQTNSCPANIESPDESAFCWHANFSTDAIKVMVRPVMCHLIDLIAFGRGKYLHGVHRGSILLDLQYIKENDLINTESSLNSYAFFSSLGETTICESMKELYTNPKPSSLRNFLEVEKKISLTYESIYA